METNTTFTPAQYVQQVLAGTLDRFAVPVEARRTAVYRSAMAAMDRAAAAERDRLWRAQIDARSTSSGQAGAK